MGAQSTTKEDKSASASESKSKSEIEVVSKSDSKEVQDTTLEDFEAIYQKSVDEENPSDADFDALLDVQLGHDMNEAEDQLSKEDEIPDDETSKSSFMNEEVSDIDKDEGKRLENMQDIPDTNESTMNDDDDSKVQGSSSMNEEKSDVAVVEKDKICQESALDNLEVVEDIDATNHSFQKEEA